LRGLPGGGRSPAKPVSDSWRSPATEKLPWYQPIYQGTSRIPGLSTNSHPAQPSDRSRESQSAGRKFPRHRIREQQGTAGNFCVNDVFRLRYDDPSTISGVSDLLCAPRGRRAVPAGLCETKRVSSVRLKTCGHARPQEGATVIVFRRYDGILARTASASRTDLSVNWRLCHGLPRVETTDPRRGGRQDYYRGQGAHAP
jgi:hypothetical protein